MGERKCTWISYSTISSGHGIRVPRSNLLTGYDFAFRYGSMDVGLYPVMSSMGWNDVGAVSKVDVAHWYADGMSGTYSSYITTFVQRPAL